MRIIDILSENDGTPPTDVDQHGNKYWRNAAGKLHREDGPAVIFSNGHQGWWRDGKLHREDGPAMIFSNGKQEWYRHGKRHREDGPAIIFADGSEEWYRDGKQHREGGPSASYADGFKEWYRHGKRHREDGPAIMAPDGDQKWWFDGDQVGPVIPIILAAGWNGLLHPQPEVVAKLDTPEQKKNIMRWLTRTARIGGNVTTAITALRKIGVRWPELKATAANARTKAKAARMDESDYDDGSHTEITSDGRKIWKNDAGQYHRENGPAVIWPNGEKQWYRDGDLHRIGGPAIIYADGTQRWYRNGKMHREDGPAYTHPNGKQGWYQHGLLHRTDGPALMYSDGVQSWRINDKETKPVIPILMAAGAQQPWHAQPEVVAKLEQPEQKKNVLRWLTRTARIGGNVASAINALHKIGVAWPELETMAANAEDRAARIHREEEI